VAQVRRLTFGIDFGIKDRKLRSANRKVDKFKSNVSQSSGALGRLRTTASLAASKIKDGFKRAGRAIKSGISLAERYRYQLGMKTVAMGAFLTKSIAAAGRLEESRLRLGVFFDESNAGFDTLQNQIQSIVDTTDRYFTEGQLNTVASELSKYVSSAESAARVMPSLAKLSVALGKDINSMVATVGRGIGSGRLSTLVNAGILAPEQLDRLQKIAEARTGSKSLRNMKAQQRELMIINALRERANGLQTKTNEIIDSQRGQWHRLKQTIGDLLETIGGPYLEIVTNALDRTSDFLDSIIETKAGKVIGVFVGIGVAILYLVSVIGFAAAGFTALSAVASAAGISLGAILGIASGLVLGIGAIALVVDDLITGLRGGNSVLVPFINKSLEWLGITTDLQTIVAKLSETLNSTFQGGKSLLINFVSTYKKEFQGIGRVVRGIGEIIGGTFGVLIGTIMLLIGKTDLAKRMFDKNFGHISDGLKNVVNGIKDVVSGIFGGLKQRIAGVLNLVNKIPGVNIKGLKTNEQSNNQQANKTSKVINNKNNSSKVEQKNDITINVDSEDSALKIRQELDTYFKENAVGAGL